MSIGPGVILGGKYRLEDSIGRGGMGEVFEATNLDTGQRVALKVVNRAFADGMLAERLRREAEAAARVHSTFVPQLYEVDRTPDGELFLVMELLHGETLAAHTRHQGGLLPWEELLQIGRDVLQGLIDAHAAGVIHRDLKPGNIFIEALPDGAQRARILDFGVCKLDAHDGDSLTTTGEAVGTIAYMAPEQIRGASKVDERADVYAFAMVVFETLSGRLAYDASGSIALIAQKLEKPARSIRDLGRMPVPEGLEGLLSRCLARRPGDRPASAAELLREWLALGPANVAPSPQAAGIHASEPPTEAGLTAAPTRTTPSARRRARVGLMVAGGALLASCVVLVAALSLRAPLPAVPAAAAATDPSPSVAPVAPPEAPAAQPPPADLGSPPLEMPPVILGGGPGVDAGRGMGGRTRPGKRVGIQGTAPQRAPREPQIVNEPRY